MVEIGWYIYGAQVQKGRATTYHDGVASIESKKERRPFLCLKAPCHHGHKLIYLLWSRTRSGYAFTGREATNCRLAQKLGMSEYTERFVENQHNLNYGDTSAVPSAPECRAISIFEYTPYVDRSQLIWFTIPFHCRSGGRTSCSVEHV
jgi:hypothetical protein